MRRARTTRAGSGFPILTIADWYDEHNYYTCAQWERYLLTTLPAELDSRPAKPFLIGESIIASAWPDTDALFSAVTTAAVQGQRADGLPVTRRATRCPTASPAATSRR